ncbi:oxidase [Phlyctema vagabunda]|uniref:Oxidase n=1 Tax=Phlyctema vagabunda TaxID=108571 RepID=A0ABR4P7R8_9HELO
MMPSKYLAVATLLNGLCVLAFPDIAERLAAQERQLPQILPFPEYPGLPTHALYNKFDAASQRVSTSGNHAWRAPGPNDKRGPCPGLNAAANHGYLPRSGIADFASVNTGLFEAFGLDRTATLLLQTTTTLFDGDPLSGRWSIGGYSPDTATLGLLQDSLLGKESGICNYGHLKSEGDASITRGDFLAPEMNSNCASYPKFFQELLDLATLRNDGNINAPVLAEHQHNRKLYSIANNPNYFAPAFAGVAFTPAAHQFVFALMANHSAEHPRGLLTPTTLMDFFSYTRESSSGALQYTYGHERIPENWYKRASDDAWTLVDIVTAVAQQCAAFPNTCQVGGNVDGVDSFAGVDLGDVSGGLVNALDLADPAKLGCFIAQNLQAEVPTSLRNVFSGALLQRVLALVPGMLGDALAPLLSLGQCSDLPPGKGVNDYGTGYPGAVIESDGPRRNDMRKV